MYWKRPMAAVSVLALTALAACGGGDDDGETSTGGPSDSETSFIEGGGSGQGQNADAPVPVPEIEGAVAGGDIDVVSISGLTTMHPSEAYYVNTASILSNLVVRSLTQYIYDAEAKQMVLVPDLATDLGTPNDDFTEWTFTLRDGIKYEDGSPVTAEDMKFGILASFDRDTFPDGAAYSNDYFLNGDKYKGPYSDPQGDCDCVTVSGNDITIKMAAPFPDMPYWGAFPAISPIPEAKAKDPNAYARHPLATGPYKFGDYKPGDTLELVRNDQWDQSTDAARHAYPDSYNMDFNTPSATIDQTILADQGDAQTMMTYDNVLAPDLAKAKQSGNLVTGGVPCTAFWYPDLRKPEWKDINVRKALGLSYSYADSWLAAGEIIGVTRIPGTTIQPPGIPSRPEEYDVFGNGGERPDTEQAKQLLTDADALGTEVSFYYVTSDPLSVDAKNANVKTLTEAGFEPKPVAVADSTAAAEMRADPNAPLNLRSGGWCSDWPSGASWMPPLFGPTGGANYSYFDEKAVNTQIKEIQTAPIDEQADLWAALDEEIMTKYYPVVNLGYYGAAMLHGSAIQGFLNDDVFGMPTWKDIHVQE